MENRNMENVDNTDNTDNMDKLSEHEFSAEYKAKKESLLAGMRDMEESGRPTGLGKRHGGMERIIKVAALLLCGVILIPVSIHAAVSVYRFTIEKNGGYASGTIELNDDGVATAADDTESMETLDAMKKRMAEEEENGTQSIMKGSDGNSYMINSGKRYVEITLDYLPEGVVQVEECKYDSPDRKGYMGISIAATQWNGQSNTVINRSIEDATVRQAGSYEYLLFERGGVDWGFDRVLYVPIKEESVILTVYIGCDITDEELDKIVTGINVKDAEGDDPSNWVGVDSTFYDDNPDNVDTIQVDDKYTFIGLDESFVVDGVEMTVNSVNVYDDTQGIDLADMLYVVGDLKEKGLVDTDGNFVDVRCRRMNEATDNSFTSWGDYNNSSLRMVAVDITYKADYRAYPYDDIVIDLERGEKLSGDKLAPPVDTNYYCGDGEPRASYERRMTYGVPAYVVDDGTEITEKSVDGYCCLKRDGEEHLLTVYFLVDESELEDCYMQVSPSSSMAGYYEYMTIYLGEGE